MKQLNLFAADAPAASKPSRHAEDTAPKKHPREKVHWRLFIDGAARNNPGPAAAGMVIYKNGLLFSKHGFFLGNRTNNQAEYMALVLGIYMVKKQYDEADHVEILSDSQLLVRQFKGEYRVKHPELKPLHMLAKTLLEGVVYTISHILREKNEQADELANYGLDNKIKLPTDFLALLAHHDIFW